MKFRINPLGLVFLLIFGILIYTLKEVFARISDTYYSSKSKIKYR